MPVTIRVPHETPMYESDGSMSRTWIIFFEKLKRSEVIEEGAAGPYKRTLLLKDTTEGNDIADHVTAYHNGTATRIVGVLRIAIEEDLTVRVNKNGDELVTITIPSGTAVDAPLEETTFVSGVETIVDGDVFSWDVTASDGQRDRAGVAAFTLEWE